MSLKTGRLVDRFLSWPLPKDFSPDCGISYNPSGIPNGCPVGTNLFTATQAKAMFEYVLAATPQQAAPGQSDQPNIGTAVRLLTDAIEQRHRKPLTDDEIRAAWKASVDAPNMNGMVLNFARAIETVHNIREEK